ncbi:MAG: hypothetical protein ACD_39C01184G0001 [uncultured bacterium]|nr:MAG: hypothetical protein ACD_39C01184G0001 [uncultured bacterium]
MLVFALLILRILRARLIFLRLRLVALLTALVSGFLVVFILLPFLILVLLIFRLRILILLLIFLLLLLFLFFLLLLLFLQFFAGNFEVVTRFFIGFHFNAATVGRYGRSIIAGLEGGITKIVKTVKAHRCVVTCG